MLRVQRKDRNQNNFTFQEENYENEKFITLQEEYYSDAEILDENRENIVNTRRLRRRPVGPLSGSSCKF